MDDSTLTLLVSTLLPVLLLVVIVVVALVVSVASHRKQAEQFQEQAYKRNGQVVSRGWLFSPQFRFPCGQLECLVYTTPGGKNTPPHTHARVTLPRPLQLTLTRKVALFGGLQKWGGLQELTGYPGLEGRFLVKCSDPYFLSAWLTPAVQDALLALHSKSLQISTRGQRLTITVVGRPRSAADYDLFLDAVTVLVQQLSAVPTY